MGLLDRLGNALLEAMGAFVISLGLLGILTLWYPWWGLFCVIAGLVFVGEATGWSFHRRKRDRVSKRDVGKAIVFLALLLVSLGMLILVDLPIHSTGILSLLVLFSIWGLYYYIRKGWDMPED